MKHKELTETFMMISNWKKPLVSIVYTNIISALRVNVELIMCYNIYSRSGNIREVLIFPNFARRTNSRILESRENYYYIISTKEKWKFANSKFCEKSQNMKFATFLTSENYQIYSIYMYTCMVYDMYDVCAIHAAATFATGNPCSVLQAKPIHRLNILPNMQGVFMLVNRCLTRNCAHVCK